MTTQDQRHTSDTESLTDTPSHLGRGRVLVFSNLGLKDHGPSLKITPTDVQLGTAHMKNLIALHVNSHLDGPTSATNLEVQFNPNIGHGVVRPSDNHWSASAELARFRVYLEGECPCAVAKDRHQQQVKYWTAVYLTGAVLAGVGVWAGGPLGAVLMVLLTAAVVMATRGR